MIRKEDWKIKFQNFAWPGTLIYFALISNRNHSWVSFSGFSTAYNEAFGLLAGEEGS